MDVGSSIVLVRLIVEKFCAPWAPSGKFLYVGKVGGKSAGFDREALAALGILVDKHDKLPDVVVHHEAKKWLFLIEAVTSHGPVSAKRRGELAELFKTAKVGLIYVTAFMDRRTMVKYLDDISWETEVWVAESPTHMVHFNGQRFLGPYEEQTPKN